MKKTSLPWKTASVTLWREEGRPFAFVVMMTPEYDQDDVDAAILLEMARSGWPRPTRENTKGLTVWTRVEGVE